MRVGIVAQQGNEQAQSLAEAIVAAIESEAVDVWVDTQTGMVLDAAAKPVGTFDSADLIVSIGGDGTFLFAARGAGTAPLVGVNLGEVGFLNALNPDTAVEAITDLVDEALESGSIPTRTVPRLTGSVEAKSIQPALNEIIVHGPQRGQRDRATFGISVDGKRFSETKADGIIVATPTGSTAYNLSEGGPLIEPDQSVFVITEMCPDEGMPPMVVDRRRTIEVTIDGCDRGLLIGDGRDRRTLSPPTTVTIEEAATPATFAGPSVEFFEALEKLE